MITEDYVSFETAKLLKEKGFDWKCFEFYEVEYNISHKKHSQRYEPVNWNGEDDENCYSAPTLQMAMKWLREVHNIFFNVNYYQLDVGNKWLQLRINIPYKNGSEISFEGFNLEEQYEQAINYSVKNLI